MKKASNPPPPICEWTEPPLPKVERPKPWPQPKTSPAVRGTPLLATVLQDLKDLERFRTAPGRVSERTYMLHKFLELFTVKKSEKEIK